jgi:hypothetical protein
MVYGLVSLIPTTREDCPAADIVGLQCRSQSRSGNQPTQAELGPEQIHRYVMNALSHLEYTVYI